MAQKKKKQPARKQPAKKKSKKLTTAFGIPVADDQNSLTAGERGPVLMQDAHLLEKLGHFDRERIPERVVHAKGAGAHGYFEVTADVTKYTKAAFLSKVGKRTEVFARFSTVGGERGSCDAARDPRGFAVKFYTEEEAETYPINPFDLTKVWPLDNSFDVHFFSSRMGLGFLAPSQVIWLNVSVVLSQELFQNSIRDNVTHAFDEFDVF